MAKRFIDSTLFRKPLVRALDAPSKLLWIYIQCECDHAGFWIPEMDVVASRLGVKMSEEKALEKLAGLVMVIPSGEWWIVDFVAFQYGILNPANRAHAAAMSLLRERGLLGEDLQPSNKLLASPFRGAMDKEKDKEQVMDKEQEKVEGVQGEPTDSHFDALWLAYERYGAKGKAIAYWHRLTLEDRAAILAKAPEYVKSTPGCEYRKQLEGWINPENRLWERPIVQRKGTAMQVALHSADVPPEAYSEQ